jgi:hypothetical protein
MIHWCKLEPGVRLLGLSALSVRDAGQAVSAALHSDLLRQLDSANSDRCVVESFEPERRPDPLFDSPVVLFDEIVQVLARSDHHSLEEFDRLPHFPHRAMRFRIGVQRDLRRLTRVLHRTPEKSFGRIHIAISAQEDYIGLVHPPGSADRTSVSPPALLEFR